MFTECLIKWVDSDENDDYEYVVIKDSEYDEETDKDFDCNIFFYGYSNDDLEEAMKNETVLEGEWVVKDILGVFDKFDDELAQE